MRGQTKCSRFFTRIFSTRWADDDWQQKRRRHQSRDHVQRRGIAPNCENVEAGASRSQTTLSFDDET